MYLVWFTYFCGVEIVILETYVRAIASLPLNIALVPSHPSELYPHQMMHMLSLILSLSLFPL